MEYPEGDAVRPLGARWIDRFLRRNPTVKTKNSVLLDSARTRGSTRANYEAFFQRLREQLDSKKIKPANIASMDGHGMQEWETRARTVIGSSLTRRAVVTTSP
jgi:4-hydroxybenzoate polyprenyltransferase